MRVGLFIPCFIDQFAPQVGIATAELLESLGVEVDFPRAQACCGQPMANLGCRDDARPLALRFARVFDESRYDHVVSPSGSCVAMVRGHYAELARTHKERELLESVGSRTRELCEFVVDILGIDALDGRYARRVGLHRGCHGLRELRLGPSSERVEAPDSTDKVEGLLRSLEGIELVDLERRDECCGFGGTFAVSEDVVSARMGNDRLDDHARGGAEAIVSTDVSCLLQLGGLAKRRGEAPEMLHVAEVLRDAVRGTGP
jgi:L-lactate dehydrogenase complex protein LldE